MDLTQFIASSSRCYEVEAEELPDFTALTSVKLRKEMDLRKISRHGMIAKAQSGQYAAFRTSPTSRYHFDVIYPRRHDKQIHREIQTYFFANIRSIKTIASDSALSYYRLVHRFLDKIGPDGRRGLATLIFPLGPEVFNHRNSQPFKHAMQLLRECKNLRTLQLCMPVFTIIGPEDHDALQIFLLHAETLELSGLENLINVLESLPRLESVRIHTEPERDRKLESRRFKADERFLEFALTSSRQDMLLREINARLQKVKDGKVKMAVGLNYIDGYTAWQERRSGH